VRESPKARNRAARAPVKKAGIPRNFIRKSAEAPCDRDKPPPERVDARAVGAKEGARRRPMRKCAEFRVTLHANRVSQGKEGAAIESAYRAAIL